MSVPTGSAARVGAFLDRRAKIDGRFCCIVTPTPALARSAAEAADDATAEGLPVACCTAWQLL